MDYFKKFNLVKYDFTTNEQLKQIFTLSDITTRVQTYYTQDELENLLINYTIKEWDTPEKISYDLYGTTEFYWTILYINNLFDMFSDWPLTNGELQTYAEKTYPGTAASPSDNYAVVADWYSTQTYQIPLPKTNYVTVDPIFPTRVNIGTYIDPAIAGEGARVTGVTSTSTVITITIDRPTWPFPNGSPGESTYEPVVFHNFADPIEEYLGIDHYMTNRGVLKDLSAKVEDDTMFAVTKLDKLNIENEKKRRIKVVRPDEILRFSNLYFSNIMK